VSIIKSTTPTYLDLHTAHRQVLKYLQKSTGRSLRSLITEAIEDLAVRYEVVKEKQHIYSRTDLIPKELPVVVTIESKLKDLNK
jgi:hypothetical protein